MRNKLVVFLLVLGCIVWAAGNTLEDRAKQRRPHYLTGDTSTALVPATTYEYEKEPVLVSLLDGRLVAVDRDTGQKLWTWNSGQPLLSASQDSSEDQNSRGTFSGVQRTIFPGADGSLYSSRREGQYIKDFKKLSVNVAEAANTFPSLTEDGELVMGNSSSDVIYLDPLTGEERSDDGGLTSITDLIESEGEEAGELGASKYVGRNYRVGWQRHVVRSFDAVSNEALWKVTYGKIWSIGLHSGTVSDLMGLEAGPNGTLARRDVETGEQLWRQELSSPALAAFTPTGAEVVLKHAAFPSDAPSGPAPLPGGVEEGVEDEDAQDVNSGVMVGEWALGLYALPAPRGHSSTGIVTAPLDQAQVPIEVDRSLVPMIATGVDNKWMCLPGPQRFIRALPQQPKLFLPPAQTHNDSPMIIGADLGADNESTSEEEGSRAGDGLANRTLMGWLQVGAGALIGACVVGALTHSYDVGKPRLWTTLDKTHQKEGITTMNVEYTGSQEEAREASEAALQNELAARAATPQLSTIRDHTGSGVGNDPDENRRRARKRWKKARHPRYSNKMMGAIKESAHEGDSSASGDEDGEDNEVDGYDEEDGEPAADDLNASDAPMSEPSSRSATVQSREIDRYGVSRVGRMEIGPEILGYGSSGTLVFEGTLHGRPIAVKRILSQFYELARKEIGALILSDEHPNIVRCFAMEEDNEFVYLALERCRQSLNDLVNSEGGANSLVDEARMPRPYCMQVVEEAGRGLVALHQRGIVHRDIKPQNILLTESRHAKLSDMGLCKRLAIDQSSFESRGPGGSTGWQAPEQLISRSGGDVRQGKSVDIFSFGLVIFYCLTGGKHAFGESYERDFNILQGRANLREISHLKEAESLVRAMLVAAPKKRPSIASVMAHPFWWDSHRRLSFLVDLSDRMENEDREEDQSLLAALEASSESALGGRNWMARLDSDFLDNLGRYRKYRPDSLRDILRVIRNKHNHFRELPDHLQAKLGPLPDGFLSYFSSRFPNLLMATYCFGLRHCADEPMLAKYYPPGAREFPLDLISACIPAVPAAANTVAAIQGHYQRTQSMPLPGGRAVSLPQQQPLLGAPPAPKAKSAPDASMPSSSSSASPASREQQGTSQGSPFTSSGPMRNSNSALFAQGAASGSGRHSSESNGFHISRNGYSHRPPPLPPPQHRSSSPSTSSRSSGRSAQYPPQAPPSLARSSPSGSIWSMSGSSLLGPSWAFPPPDQPYPMSSPQPLQNPFQQQGLRMGSGMGDSGRLRGGSASLSDAGGSEASLRASLHFQQASQQAHGSAVPPPPPPPPPNAPQDAAGGVSGPLSMQQPQVPALSFPSRPGQPLCDFYTKTGHCKFGEACKFDHPLEYGVLLNQLGLPLRPNEAVCSHFEKTRTCKFGPACKFHHPEISL